MNKKINLLLGFLFFINLLYAQSVENKKRPIKISTLNSLQITGCFATKFSLYFESRLTSNNEKASILISFPFRNVVRVRIRQGKNNMLQPDSGKNFNLSETNYSYIVKTDSLILQIQKNPWKISLNRTDGSAVFSQIGEKSGFINYADSAHCIRISAKMLPKEGFFGFGEKFNGMNQQGRKVEMKIYDAYVERGARAYKSIPFFISSAHYGLLVNSGLPLVFDLGKEDSSAYSFEIPDTEIDFYIFAGRNPLNIIRQYTDITGKSRLIPKWALEPWLSRRGMTGWNNTATVEADIDMYLRHGFPLGVILWEGIRGQFKKKQVPDLHALSDKWHALGIKQIFWSLSGHLQENQDILKKTPPDYFIRNSDGSFAIGGFKGGHVYLDVSNPKAMKWWERAQYAPYLGSENSHSAPGHANLDGVKIDFCELFPKYTPPLLMKKQVKGIENLHSVLFSEQIYDWLQHIKPDGGITWVRGGGLGIQRVGYAWAGDRQRTFPQFRETVSASLSLSLCGVALSGSDLGGYIGGNAPDARNVYIRGAQYAAFSPAFHDHGSAPAPWEQDEYGKENYKFYARLRYNLIPCLYHYVRIAASAGTPIMRPLFLHYPDDEKAYSIEDEYLLGDELLVAPFVNNGVVRDIYLPKGEWIDFWNGETRTGAQTIRYTAALNRIPVFAKKGAVIPLQLNNDLQIGGAFTQQTKNELLLTFLLFDGDNSGFTFYDDKDSVRISTYSENRERRIIIENINHNFGLTFRGMKPDRITANSRKLSCFQDSEFSSKRQGWTYDKKQMIIKIKLDADNKKEKYTVRVRGLNRTEYKQRIKKQLKEAAEPPARPQIASVVKWGESMDVYFRPVKGAFAYIAQYGTNKNSLDNTLENIYESPLTISNLSQKETVYIRLIARNEYGVSPPSSLFSSKSTNRKSALFNLNAKDGFIFGNHYHTKGVNENNERTFTYSVFSPEERSVQLWLKARKNIGHHLYFRWYYRGEINLKKGVNALQLVTSGKKTEINRIYLTAVKKDRPIMKKETEMESIEKIFTLPDEKIVVQF